MRSSPSAEVVMRSSPSAEVVMRSSPSAEVVVRSSSSHSQSNTSSWACDLCRCSARSALFALCHDLCIVLRRAPPVISRIEIPPNSAPFLPPAR